MSNNNTYYYCHIEGDTNVGCKRKANEDWLDTFECDNGLVAVVCDGMGGHVGGQVASHVAIDAIRFFLCSMHFADPKEAIVEACNAANSAILQRATEQPELTGMGSTCVMLIVRDGKVYMGSVGDSRIYLVRSKTIRQLTKDQSYVQMLVDAGQITQEQAEHHPRKNEITNALGLAAMQPAIVLEDPINPEAGDCFLLCSDGLSGMVSDHEIAKIVGNQTGMSQRDRVNALIEKARKNGGLDNITCQIVEFAVTPPGVNPDRPLKEKWIKIILPIIACILLLFGIGYVGWKHFFPDEPEESQFAHEMKQIDKTHVFEIPKDTLLFIKGVKPIIEIEEIDQMGVIFYVTNKTGDIDTIRKSIPMKLSTITVNPSENLSVKPEGKKCLISFTDREYTEPDLSIVLKGGNDSTYCFIFPVEKPATKVLSKPKCGENAEPKLGNNSTSAKTQKVGKVIEDNTADIDDPINGTETKLDYTFTFDSEDVKTITLHSTKGQNSESDIYTPEYWYDVQNISTDWYEIKNNRNICVITIRVKEIPSKDNFIDIPTQEKGKKIHIIIKKK